MQTNKNKNQIELAQSLKLWWKSNKDNRHKWTANPIGCAIREMLTESGNFKYAPRGKAQIKETQINKKLEEIDLSDSLW